MDSTKLDQRLNSLSNSKDMSKVGKLFTLFAYDAIWYQAYQNIYSNRGAFTKGVNSDTLDGFDKLRLDNIKDSIFTKTYTPTPVRRVLIPKSNGKTRPLGIPTGTDKLVQEACRIILEAIYEPKFSDKSHGFRSNRSCHSALKEIYNWTAAKWFIEVDIKGYFDNINHNILIEILEKKIRDERFINLIRKFFKAGYMENWKHHKSFTGTPQGGIISPILANIYLDEFDKYITDKCNTINSTKNERKMTKEYSKVTSKTKYNKNKMDKIALELDNVDAYIAKTITPLINVSEELRTTLFQFVEDRKDKSRYIEYRDGKLLDNIFEVCEKYNLDYDTILKVGMYKYYESEFKRLNKENEELVKERNKLNGSIDTSYGLNRLWYVRYADDFVLGYIGTKVEAELILDGVKLFLKDKLKLETAVDKTKVVHREDGIVFLGYNISYQGQKQGYTTSLDGVKRKRNVNKPVFKVPTPKAINFVHDKKYGSYIDSKSEHKGYLINFDIYEIINQYNAELRGLMNYYKYAVNAKDIIGRVQWISHYSMLKTIAGKHKCSVAQLFKNNIIKTRQHPNGGKQWYYKIPNTDKDINVYNIKETKYTNISYWDGTIISDNYDVNTINIRNSAVKKLIKDTCELCGKKSDEIAIHQHHLNAVKNIPKTDTLWDKAQKMRLRKTIAVCVDCHNKLHRLK